MGDSQQSKNYFGNFTGYLAEYAVVPGHGLILMSSRLMLFIRSWTPLEMDSPSPVAPLVQIMAPKNSVHHVRRKM